MALLRTMMLYGNKDINDVHGQKSAVATLCKSAPFNPCSLESICCSYITQNMNLVDSFEGLPLVVGELILNACFKSGALDHQTKTSEHIMSLFVSAYPEDMVTGFKLGRDDRRYIGKFAEFLGDTLRFVVELDLEGCSLVADDFLNYLGEFEYLEKLDLSNNQLSDEGMRLLLAKHKVFQNGFAKLKALSLKGSHLGLSNLQTVLKFPSLRQLEFSVSIKKLQAAVKTKYPAPKHGFDFGNNAFFAPKLNLDVVRNHIRKAGFSFTTDPNSLSFRRSREGQLAARIGNWIRKFDSKIFINKKSTTPSAHKNNKISESSSFDASAFYINKVPHQKNLPDGSPLDSEKLEHYSVYRTNLNRKSTSEPTVANKRPRSSENLEDNSKKRKKHDDDIFDLYK